MLVNFGIVVFLGILLVALSGFFAPPYSRWGLFVNRYITGDYYRSGHSLMWKSFISLMICIVARFALSEIGS
jgi:hypothetical protein